MLPSRHATAQLQHTACHAVPCPQPVALPLPAPTPLELAWCRSTCGVQRQSLAAARRCTALRMLAAGAARRRPCVSWRLTAQPLLPVPQEQRRMAAFSFRRRVAPAGGGGGRVQQRSGDAWPLPALLSVVSERALAPSARRGDKPDPERRGARRAAGRGCQTVRSFPMSYQQQLAARAHLGVRRRDAGADPLCTLVRRGVRARSGLKSQQRANCVEQPGTSGGYLPMAAGLARRHGGLGAACTTERGDAPLRILTT